MCNVLLRGQKSMMAVMHTILTCVPAIHAISVLTLWRHRQRLTLLSSYVHELYAADSVSYYTCWSGHQCYQFSAETTKPKWIWSLHERYVSENIVVCLSSTTYFSLWCVRLFTVAFVFSARVLFIFSTTLAQSKRRTHNLWTSNARYWYFMRVMCRCFVVDTSWHIWKGLFSDYFKMQIMVGYSLILFAVWIWNMGYSQIRNRHLPFWFLIVWHLSYE